MYILYLQLQVYTYVDICTAADVNINTAMSDSSVMEGMSASICVNLQTSPMPTITLKYDLTVPLIFNDGKAGKQSVLYYG